MYYLSASFYYLLLLPISLLPFGLLYRLADGLSWLFFNVVGYRKKVVMQNIRNAFPDKSEAEIQQIGRDFYDHLCNLMVETVKAFTMTREDFMKRLEFSGLEQIDEYAKQGRSVILAAGHCHNFEWHRYQPLPQTSSYGPVPTTQ
jgi:Kdo2-lipid IVA lauroyltransferase/acyltransferase